jgi:PAS domain S-box-containing protein
MAASPDIPTDFAPRALPASRRLSPHAQALRLRRTGFLMAAAACAVACVALRWVDPVNGGNASLGTAVLLFACLALAALSCLWLPQPAMPTALTALMGAIVLALAGSAALLGWGLASPGLVVLGLLVFALGAANGWRAAAGLAALAAAAVLALFEGWLPGASRLPVSPGAGPWLAVHLVAIGSGLGGGAMASAALSRRLRSAGERERRFRGLLALAADAYWEIDAQYRLVAAIVHDDESRQLTPAGGLGALPWESPRFLCDADTLDMLQADLDARAPFRELPVGWLTRSGRTLRFVVSGEPRFGERGEFIGYWGVARDVSADTAEREAMLATETRYQELFSRIPTPLVLHRGGRMFDANPAALALFDEPDLKSLLQRDLLAIYEAGDSRERARRRVEELERLPPGSALPVTDFRLNVNGRQAWVRATGVRVAADGGPATLAIYLDDTERRAAEDAVRRSEAMLSHLVATSPDLITLTDMATGRYVMVNRTFERVLGHPAAEAVGRTSLELGVWRHAGDRERLVERIRGDGSVADLPTTFVSREGREMQLLVSAARFAMDRREYLVINARDVTESERLRLEREAILANASVGIAVTRERRFVLANRHFETLFGWPPGAVVGEPGSAVWLGEADYAEVGALVGAPLQRGEAVTLERMARRRDGSSFLARIHGRAVDPARPAAGGTVWIVEDITERHSFELALARARDDAEAASRAKSAFLANTSHELRTPLNGMIGLAQLARDPALQPALRQQYLDQIADSAQALAGVISDILDLSKIEAGKLHIESARFDLGELLQSLQRTYGTLAAARQLDFGFDLGGEVATMVVGDPLRVRQILSNYLSNALKFTERGGVVLTVRRCSGGDTSNASQHARDGEPGVAEGGADHGVVRFEVRDTGPGIEPEVLERLFKPFSQADESTTRRFGGTGLGLSICRELAALMGGGVGVHSAPGAGSTFWAELPLPAAAEVQGAEAPAPGPTLQGRRVLLVEDNPVNMMIAAAMLERWGVQVAQAGDGQQAVLAVQSAAAAGTPFDAILMDVQMPVMSGHEATRALRASAHGRQLPIIALTAAALVTERDAAMDAGMDDFLTKPIDAERLRGALARWIAQPRGPSAPP